MDIIKKLLSVRGNNTKTSNIVTFDLSSDLPANGIVMIDESDTTCQTVKEWDGVDECAAVGCLLGCPLGAKAGNCVPVRIFDRDLSVGKTDSNTRDSEVLCFCDDTGTRFLGHITYDYSTDPATKTFEYTLMDGTAYTPVGDIKKAPMQVEKKQYDLIEPQVELLVGSASAVTLTPPANATGAEIIFETPCCMRVRLDGVPATDSTGTKVSNGAQVCLGCTENSSGLVQELTNFSVIAELGCDGKLIVNYYEEV